ncbi:MULTISPECIES: J domain-containing protein [unclassified Duganella]|uniref:J domain-containing protein n=1 Tax=unclassified Duganella TaxID=2636909 RepID=UPI00088ACCCF|nr:MULTISPECIES: J domain-containing protein [unclassified Duganella]SDH49274.1 hypothetical protein SAMN05216320_11442 [Duganella sp. OV458]SDK64095.1 hypothetical protein SAMN05428973_11458 [Duganella sp. OV510]
MTTKSLIPVSIAADGAAPLSPARKRFNTLLNDLDKQRDLMLLWQQTLPQLRQLQQQELMPLAQRHDACLRQMVFLLDQAYDHKSMGVRNRDKLAQWIAATADDLLQFGDDPELQQVFGKYVEPIPEDEDDPLARQMMEMLAGRPDVSAPEAFWEALRAGLGEQATPPPPRPGKPPGPSKREQREAAAQEEIKLSVREIYRKLASALHPDRETDTEQRLRKTALMQRVNVAYQKNDLLALLELQLEIEQIDQAHIDALSDQRIAQFNAVLSAQVKELKSEIFAIGHDVAYEWELPLYRQPKPGKALGHAQDEVQQLRQLVARAEADLASFHDIKYVKAWLKTCQPPADEDEFYW